MTKERNNPGEIVLNVENLYLDIPTPAGDLHAIRGVSFRLKRGETLGIVGESGCGKSVSTMAIVGLLPSKIKISAKQLEFSGINLLGMSERQFADIRGERIAIIFQGDGHSLKPLRPLITQMTFEPDLIDGGMDWIRCHIVIVQHLSVLMLVTIFPLTQRCH